MTATLFRGFFACLLLLLTAAPAFSAPKTYVTLPFVVNGPAKYAYLDQAIPQMLGSRLYWKDNFHQIATSTGASAAKDEAAASAAQASAGADYAIWGTATILGEDCSIDVMVRDASGHVWPHAVTTTISGLIPSLQIVSDSISAEIFKRPVQQATAQTRTTQAPPPLNPDLMVNETDSNTSPMNPNMRIESYTSDMASRLQSQALSFSSSGMEVADLDNDGVNEIVMISDTSIYVLHWQEGRLIQRAEMRAPTYLRCVKVVSFDVNNDGAKEIIVSGHDFTDKMPASFILSWREGRLTMLEQRIPYFLNVVKLPPSYNPMLIGQQGEPTRVFRPGVYEMVTRGGKLTHAGKLTLPEGTNVFNFVYLPANPDSKDGDKIIRLSGQERLQVFTDRGARLSESDEAYSGTSAGIMEGSEMPGMGEDRLATGAMYYVPMHMIVADLERDGIYTLLLNHPVSTAAQIFQRYRNYPQGEIEALYWDGVGLSLQWKTRRIKGSVVDQALLDLDGDGKLDLVLNINTYAGALGASGNKSMLLVYPLNTGTDAGEIR